MSKLQINAEMQTNYNGWSCGNEGDYDFDLFDTMSDSLSDITSACYDENGEIINSPTMFESEIIAKLKEIANQPCNITIKYDNFST